MPPAIPTATYRLQFSKDFGFRQAAALVPYLRDLGISHVYASPFLQAREGSTHGYDVVDHNRIDPQFGGEAEFDRFCGALAEAGLGLILDFVPNHMGIGRTDNAWWLDMLEWGPASPYAFFFDIDWRAAPGRSRPAVTLPILGKPYGQVLEEGELKLAFDVEQGSFSIRYFEHRLPVRPADYPALLRQVAGMAELPELRLSPRALQTDRSAADKLKAALAGMPRLAAAMDSVLSAYDACSGAVARHRLHRLLLRQHYMPAYWRSSGSEINYRRFFDINDLAGLRMEDPAVFEATHRLVGDLIRAGRLQGIRLDHVDGLYDPVGYCRMLGDHAVQCGAPSDFYIVIEKILGRDEALPQFPSVAGTTGYEWMNAIARLFVSDDGLTRLDTAWRAFTGQQASYEDIEQSAKAEVIATMFAGELATLVRLLRRIAAGHARSQDFTAEQLRSALLAYVRALPVYRTYVTPENGASDQDRAIIRSAISAARKAAPRIESALFDFLQDLFTLDLLQKTRGYSRRRISRFIGKLQQFTGPVMAKSLEDTCFYRYTRLIGLNEVGGHPDGGGLDGSGFHRAMRQRLDQQPHGLTATATHDMKRGEDARLRLAALSEMADEWQEAVQRWQRWNQPLLGDLSGQRAPSADHEYLLYQALLGAWPLKDEVDFADRAVAYTVKAMREGKQETSWHYPNEDYEKVVESFLRGLLDPVRSPEFSVDFADFARRTSLLGALNSLSQVAIKMMMPGVPDVYQGTEFWDLSFVDPDNRRPVDYPARQQVLAQTPNPDWATLAADWPDGRIKLRLLETLLRLRKRQPEIFTSGDYQPVDVTGTRAGSVIAFSRSHAGRTVIIAAGRLLAGLSEGGRQWIQGAAWGDTTINLPADGAFVDCLQTPGKTHRGHIVLGEGFAHFPVGVFVSGP